MREMDGRRQINGKHGKLWWDGELIFEIEAFEARIIANREDVDLNGSMDIDSKLMSLTGEGTMTLKKVYSRGVRKLLDAWKEGIDPRSTLTGLLDDPDTIGGQKERVTFNNVWFNEMTLMAFEGGTLATQEYPFGYRVSQVDIQESID